MMAECKRRKTTCSFHSAKKKRHPGPDGLCQINRDLVAKLDLPTPGLRAVAYIWTTFAPLMV